MFELDKARIYQIIGVKKKRQEVNLPLGSKDPIYQVYRGMFQRCYDPKSRNYKNYGARGIEICLRWQGENGFVNFYGDMGVRPEGHNQQGERIPYTIERRNNNNGNYEPSNCCWAPALVQRHNQRN